MRKLGRILTLGLAMVMIFAMLLTTAFAATKFVDVDPENKELTEAVTLLEGLGITNGVSATNFGTEGSVTRQQMAAFVYRFMKGGKSAEGGDNTSGFEDLYDDTYYTMVSWASTSGIIKGRTPTTFDPDGYVTLQEAYAMVVRALGYEKAGEIAYPHGFIDIAEAKLDLGKNLPAKVTYTSKLTRGNVAIILYNAFYAEMAVDQKEAIDNPLLDQFDVEAETTRVCEKIYGLQEDTFTVRETTHYSFNDSADDKLYNPTKDEMGLNTMLLVNDDEESEGIDQFYITAEELGFTEADPHIMSTVRLFYTYDEKANKIDNIYFAESLMASKTTNSITVDMIPVPELRSDKTWSYYDGDTSHDFNRLCSGTMTIDHELLYFFDTPYSVLKPSYKDCETEQDKYDARNADNTKFIELECTDVDGGYFNYYVLTGDEYNFVSGDGCVKTDDGWVKDTENYGNFAYVTRQIRSSGVYKANIYDPDGDGRYEYIWYKPAVFGQIVMDDKYEFQRDGMNNTYIDKDRDDYDPMYTPQIYANGATLYGSAFSDGDFVIAYINQAANMIDIIGLTEVTRGNIVDVDNPNYALTLNGKTYQWAYNFKAVDNYANGDTEAYKIAHAIGTYPLTEDQISRNATFYTYKGSALHPMLLHYVFTKEAKAEYSGEKVLVPIEEETIVLRNNVTFENEHYLKVLMGDQQKLIKVDPENCYPKPKLTANGTYNFNEGDAVVVADNSKKYGAYVGKLCKYTVDKNGFYTLEGVIHGEDEDGKSTGISTVFDAEVFFDKEETKQVANDLGVFEAGETITSIKKTTKTRYTFKDALGYNMIGTYGEIPEEAHWFNDVYVSDSAVFMFRLITEDEDGKIENEIVTYTGKDFPGTTAGVEFKNAQYIYKNYGSSETTCELVLFYAEVEGELNFETEVSDADYTLVVKSKPVLVAEKEYRYSYTLLDPITGNVAQGVLGTLEKSTAAALRDEAPMAPGSIVVLTTDGKVNDKAGQVEDVLDVENNTNLAFLSHLDVEGNLLELELVNSGDDEYFTDKDDQLHTIFELAEDVKVSVLNYAEKSDLTTATVTEATLEDLAKASKAYKCYAEVLDGDDFEIAYAENVKMYITYTKKAREEFAVIDSILVLVHGDEQPQYLEED